MKYIKAEWFEKFIHRNEWGTPDETWRPESEFGKFIDYAPTEDVKPVVRGEWVYKNDNIAIPTGYWECSICGKGKLLYEQNFCPNCGADMRGENDVRITD